MRRKNAECPAPGLRSGCDGATCRSATSSASGHLICRTNPIFREAADHYMEVGIARRKRRMTQKASWRMEYWSVRILMSWALTALPFRNAGLIALNVFRASQRKVRVSLPECHDVNRNGPEEKRNFCRTNPNFRKYVQHNNKQRSKCTSERRDPLTSRLTADTEGHPLTPTLSPSGGEGEDFVSHGSRVQSANVSYGEFNGFPSPPRVSCPAIDVRFAHCGPLPRREQRGRRWMRRAKNTAGPAALFPAYSRLARKKLFLAEPETGRPNDTLNCA